jgi:DNA-binding LytR/AlgR family response regulator
MKKIFNVIAVDDDRHFLNLLENHLKDMKDINIVALIQDGNEIPDILAQHQIDVIFLDIDMPDLNGLEIAKFMNDNYPKTKIIFLTGEVQYALEAYQYYPFDYIVKPINTMRLQNSLLKIVEQEEGYDRKTDMEQNVRLGIKVKKGLRLVTISDIVFVEKINRKVMIHLKNDACIETNENLKCIESKLSKYNFYRPHQSYLIPLNRIKTIKPDDFMNSYNIELYHSRTEIKVSKHKYKELKERLMSKNIII